MERKAISTARVAACAVVGAGVVASTYLAKTAHDAVDAFNVRLLRWVFPDHLGDGLAGAFKRDGRGQLPDGPIMRQCVLCGRTVELRLKMNAYYSGTCKCGHRPAWVPPPDFPTQGN